MTSRVPGRFARVGAVTVEAGTVSWLQRCGTISCDCPAPMRAVHEVLSTPGEPLPVRVRAVLGPRFGRDFSTVRTHTDPAAAGSARQVGAHAYTVGEHVVFGAGQYQPDTTAGRRIIAHELAHVLQQRSAGPAAIRPGRISHPDSAEERRAEATAATVLAGATVEHQVESVPAAPDIVHRQVEQPPQFAGVPRSSSKSLKPDGLTDEQILQELRAIAVHLQQATSSSAADDLLAATGVFLAQTLAARHPEQLPQPLRSSAVQVDPTRVRAADVREALKAAPPVVAAGVAAPALAPVPAPPVSPLPTPPVRPPFGLVPPVEPVPVRIPLPPPAVVAPLAFLVVLLWPSEIGPEWPHGRPEEQTPTAGPRLGPGTGPLPRVGPQPHQRRHPEQRCTNEVLDERYPKMKSRCDEKRSCSMQGDTCGSAMLKAAAGYACIDDRTWLQQNCFSKDHPDYEDHMKQIAEASAARRECERVMREKCP